MSRLDSMLERLPPLYDVAKESLLGRLLSVVENAQLAFDEDRDRVQRAHWHRTAYTRVDLDAIGALFDLRIQPWEPLELYRERLRSTVAARLEGAVTRDVLDKLIVRIVKSAQQGLGLRFFDVPAAGRAFVDGPALHELQPVFVEFPERRTRAEALVRARGLLKPLDQVTLHNRGVAPAALEGVVRGVAGRRTVSPVLANLDTGQVLVYVGDVPCGSELSLTVSDGCAPRAA